MDPLILEKSDRYVPKLYFIRIHDFYYNRKIRLVVPNTVIYAYKPPHMKRFFLTNELVKIADMNGKWLNYQ